jgi:hypothetical protein
MRTKRKLKKPSSILLEENPVALANPEVVGV